MELNWTTFIFEIINLLVLIWLLSKFLYHPIQSILQQRRDQLQQTEQNLVIQAQQLEEREAELQRQKQQWRAARDQQQYELRDELEGSRQQALQRLTDELDQLRTQEREKHARQLRSQRDDLTRQALEQGSRFASKLLKLAATAELQTHLIRLFLEQLQNSNLKATSDYEQKMEAHVTTAFPLSTAERDAVADELAKYFGGAPLKLRFEEDLSLIAGIKFSLGAWVVSVSLQDELRGFALLSKVGQP